MKSLERNGYKASYFETLADAADYIANQVSGVTVGFGDSATLASLGLAERLSKTNSVIDPSSFSGAESIEVSQMALTADVFLT